MKKLLTLIFISLSFLIQAQDFTITNFDIDLEINKDGSFTVNEIIDVNFSKKKRGIYRKIDNAYKINNAKIYLDIHNIDIMGHDYKVDKNKNEVSIKIGNPDIYLTGNQQYRISYKIKNGIIDYPEHQEFHYDFTGNEWNAPIENVNYTIKLPKNITLSEGDFKVTGGKEGQNIDLANIRQVDTRTIKGNSTSRLNKYSGLTAAIKLPKRYLEVANNNVTFYEPEEEKVYKPWYIALPLAIFGFFVSFWRKVRKTDFVEDENAISTYPPEGLTSAHVGAFVDQTAHTRDIVSLIPYWGSEGYIEMKQVHDEVYIYKMKNLPAEFPENEHIVYDRMFEENDMSKLRDLKTKFYTSLTKAQSLLTKEVKLQEYYNPKYLKLFRSWKLVLFPIAMIALGLLSIIYFKLLFLGIGFFAVALGGFILPLFNLPLTYKGAKLKSEIDAFKRFIKKPDDQVLSELLKDDPSYFDKMFPFAVAFGLEKSFLNKVEPYMTTAPYWYHSGLQQNSFSTFSTSFKPEEIQSAFSSVPHSSSGGGSSGGGFSSGSGVGGGGGGSW